MFRSSLHYSVLRLALMALAVFTLAGSALAGSNTISNIDHMTGWEHCTACAGAGGTGSTAYYSMKQFVSSPSMDGKSVMFSLGGSTPFSNALWWKQLGPKDSAHNFKYDVYFYIKNPAAAQSLEFDVNQALNGKKYIFGTQCSFVRGTFDVYSASLKWVHTGVPCTAAKKAYMWHHLVWELQRTTDNKVKFVAVTLDGVRHYVNKVYAPKSSSVHELDVAFQMDGNKNQTDYQTWLDKIALTYW